MSKLKADYRAQLEKTGVGWGMETAALFKSRWGKEIGSRITDFDGSLTLEIGCADAVFLMNVARRFPEKLFVGIDWKGRSLCEAADQIVQLGLRNVALILGNVRQIKQVFAKGEVSEAWLFHPEPCAEEKQAGHRLFARPFLQELSEVLEGRMCLKTDHPGYFQWALGLFGENVPGWFERARLGQRLVEDPKIKSKEVFGPELLPATERVLKTLYRLCEVSFDYWQDEAELEVRRRRLFAGLRTLYEARFAGKRLPIYFLELERLHATATASCEISILRPADCVTNDSRGLV